MAIPARFSRVILLFILLHFYCSKYPPGFVFAKVFMLCLFYSFFLSPLYRPIREAWEILAMKILSYGEKGKKKRRGRKEDKRNTGAKAQSSALLHQPTLWDGSWKTRSLQGFRNVSLRKVDGRESKRQWCEILTADKLLLIVACY